MTAEDEEFNRMEREADNPVRNDVYQEVKSLLEKNT